MLIDDIRELRAKHRYAHERMRELGAQPPTLLRDLSMMTAMHLALEGALACLQVGVVPKTIPTATDDELRASIEEYAGKDDRW